MPLDWFRFYTETIRDKKIRQLPVSQRWLWVTILALARESEEPGKLLKWGDVPMNKQDLAQAAGVELSDVTVGLRTFRDTGMIHAEGSVIVVSNWSKRQHESDHSTPRVQKHRAKNRNVSGNGGDVVEVERGVRAFEDIQHVVVGWRPQAVKPASVRYGVRRGCEGRAHF